MKPLVTVVLYLTIALGANAQVHASDWRQGFFQFACNPFMPYYTLTPHWVDGAAMRQPGHPSQPAGEVDETWFYDDFITLGVGAFHTCDVSDISELGQIELRLYDNSAYFDVKIDGELILSYLSASPRHHISADNRLYNSQFLGFYINKGEWTLKMAFVEKGEGAMRNARVLELSHPVGESHEPVTYDWLKAKL